MERCAERMQNALQEDRANDVKFVARFDIKTIKEIAKASGSPTLARETGYLERAKFYAGRKFRCEIGGDICFFAGTIGKKHFRLIEIAVRKEEHGKGYGRRMMWRIISICRKNGLRKITLRTNRNENSINFYKKFGGKIIGIEGNDYEIEVPLCFTSSLGNREVEKQVM